MTPVPTPDRNELSIATPASQARIPYWWVQAYRPSPQAERDTEIKEYLGVPAKLD